jgi:hypothetical protein
MSSSRERRVESEEIPNVSVSKEMTMTTEKSQIVNEHLQQNASSDTSEDVRRRQREAELAAEHVKEHEKEEKKESIGRAA